MILLVLGAAALAGVIYHGRAASGTEPAQLKNAPPQTFNVYVSNPHVPISVSCYIEANGPGGLTAGAYERLEITVRSPESYPRASLLIISSTQSLDRDLDRIRGFGPSARPVFASTFSLRDAGTIRSGSVTTYVAGTFPLRPLAGSNGSIFGHLPSLDQNEAAEVAGSLPYDAPIPLLAEQRVGSTRLRDVILNPGPAEEAPMQTLPPGYEPPNIRGELFWPPEALSSAEILQGAKPLLGNMRADYMTPPPAVDGDSYVWTAAGGVEPTFKVTDPGAADSQSNAAFFSGIAFGVAGAAAIALIQELPAAVAVPARRRETRRRRRPGRVAEAPAEGDPGPRPGPGGFSAPRSVNRWAGAAVIVLASIGVLRRLLNRHQ